MFTRKLSSVSHSATVGCSRAGRVPDADVGIVAGADVSVSVGVGLTVGEGLMVGVGVHGGGKVTGWEMGVSAGAVGSGLDGGAAMQALKPKNRKAIPAGGIRIPRRAAFMGRLRFIGSTVAMVAILFSAAEYIPDGMT
jgi:hypothetical protein